MIPTILRTAAALAIPAMMLFGAATAGAASLSPAAPLERAIAASEAGTVIKVGEGNQLRAERQLLLRDLYGDHATRRHHSKRRYHRRHSRNSGVYFGFAPFIGNNYRSYRSRGTSSSCSYWSRRCAANWGYGNSNYYGCMQYEGC
jgi:hypothetical protein